MKVQERLLSRHKFGNALVSAHTALNDPQESVKDETLMAVLILGLYEVRSSVSIQLIMRTPLWMKYCPPNAFVATDNSEKLSSHA